MGDDDDAIVIVVVPELHAPDAELLACFAIELSETGRIGKNRPGVGQPAQHLLQRQSERVHLLFFHPHRIRLTADDREQTESPLSRFADRFDHVLFAATSSAAMSVALVGAILVPSLPASIALFALAGVATGPVFPMIIVIGGDRYPDRTSAVSGLLTGSAVVGSIIYPPVMGFLSVTVGLTVAMLGAALLGFAAAGSLLLVGRRHPMPA